MSDWLVVFREEFRRIFRLKPAFSVLILSVAIYAVFYPQPYLNEALRDVPIAVVDLDQSSSSRELARLLDATPDVAVARVLPDLASAQREVFLRTVSGIVVVPKYFERDLLHGRASPIALYADASYFLIYQRVSAAVTGVAHGLGAEIETARLIAIGIDPAVAGVATDPMPLTAVPLFNPQGGYATYLLPAAFVLILQQTLLIGIGLLNTLPAGGYGTRQPGVIATILGKMSAYLTLEIVIMLIYLIVLPHLYGIPRLGSVPTVLAMGVPFILAVSGLGLVMAAIFRKPLAVQLASAAIGLPFFFLADFAWPSEAIPPAIRLVSFLLPSTSAIDGIVRVSQLGGTVSDAHLQFLTLWGLAGVYGLIAIVIEAMKRRTLASRPPVSGLGAPAE